jgi:hypothetical protein
MEKGPNKGDTMNKIRTWGILCCALATIGAARAQSTEEGFVSLFDGQSLKGWVRHGGESTYAVEDGAIELDESLWIDGDGVPQATRALIVEGMVARGGERLAWRFEKRKTGVE